MADARTRLARRRCDYTGECHQKAFNALSKVGSTEAPIPAASYHQAALESLFLQQIAEVVLPAADAARLPFGIAWVSPHVDSLEVGVPSRCLPHVAAQLIPTILTNDQHCAQRCRARVEVGGIPGLRVSHNRGATVLARPGIPGEIRLAVDARTWHTAERAIRAEWDEAVTVAWDGHPHDWNPIEENYVAQGWSERFQIGGVHYRASRLASDFLRRLPGVSTPVSCHDMWINFHGESEAEYHIQFEWALGQPPRKTLELLLDQDFGMDVDISTFYGQSTSDCYADECARVRLVDRSGTGSRIDLRRMMWPGADQVDGFESIA